MKIDRREMLPNRPPSREVPVSFDAPDDRFFSLGQSGECREHLDTLGRDTRTRVLTALRDLAANPVLLERVAHEPVMSGSMLRHVPGRSLQRPLGCLTPSHSTGCCAA